MSFFKKLFGIEDKSLPTKTEIPFEIKVTTSYSTGSSTFQKETFRPIQKDKDGFFILNPDAPFILTLITKDIEVAQQIRQILDDDETYNYRKEDKLVAVFAEHNLKIKEIEEYKTKYKKQYFDTIEKQKQDSKEWSTAGERDRDDLLSEFRINAINQLNERAMCDLEILFENEPSDITIDDELVKEYGFENMQTYLRFADNMDKVRVAPNDSYNRPKFEKLVELNLAINGTGIPKEEMLTSLTLKELNAIAKNSEKEFKRKNQAIEYILKLSNLDEMIGKHISLRELFKLKALPEKYKSINLVEIAETWSFHEQEIRLLTETFRNSYYSWKNLKDDKYVVGYKIRTYDNNCPCPRAKELSLKSFSKKNPPQSPFHIGCNCQIDTESKYD